MPDNEKLTIIKHFGGFSAAKFFGYFLGMVSGMVIVKILGPEQYGQLSYLYLFQMWGGFAGLGFVSVAHLNLPILTGRGDNSAIQEMQDIRNNCYSMELLLVSAFYLVILLVFTFKNPTLLPYFLIIALSVSVTTFTGFHSTEAYALKRFNIIIPAQFIQSVAAAFSSIVLVYFFGIYGVLIATLITGIIVYTYYRTHVPLRFRPIVQLKKILEYSKLGIPLQLGNIAFWGMRLSDRTLIAAFLTTIDLGFYSFAALAANMIHFFVDAFNQVFQPFFLQKYGEVNEIENMEEYYIKPVWIAAYIMPFIIGMCYLFFPFIVNNLFPEYNQSIQVFNILVFSGFFFSITSTTGMQIKAEYRRHFSRIYKNLAVSYLVILLNISLNYTLITLGYGIVGVAWATMVSWAVKCPISIVIAKRVKSFCNPLIFVPFATVLIYFFIHENIGFVYSVLIFVVGYIPFFIILNKKTGIFMDVYNHYLVK